MVFLEQHHPEEATDVPEGEILRWLDAGAVLKAHGVRGEMRIALDVPWDVLVSVKNIRLVARRGEARVFTVEHVRTMHGGALLALAELPNREAVQAWSGARLQLREQDIPPSAPGEYYVYELTDATVVEVSGEELGRVTEVVSNGEQPLLVLSSAAGERLLPLVPATVRKFDRATRVLTVAVPPGLWE